MCTETFLHLPEEKRNRFLEAAWEEFTSVSYAEASINQIVRRAGVPRGSFYQYFTDKQDLFLYLMSLIQTHLIGEFQQMVSQGKGDLFQTLLLCYDRFVRQGPAADALFDRLIRILQLNSGLHLQMTLMDQPDQGMLLAIWSQLDLSAFRSQDWEYIRHIFLLSLISLAVAVKDTLTAPENADIHRRDLCQRLEIIRHGSLVSSRPEPDHSKEEVTYA